MVDIRKHPRICKWELIRHFCNLPLNGWPSKNIGWPSIFLPDNISQVSEHELSTANKLPSVHSSSFSLQRNCRKNFPVFRQCLINLAGTQHRVVPRASEGPNLPPSCHKPVVTSGLHAIASFWLRKSTSHFHSESPACDPREARENV
jgi:hypothetical protein